MQLPLPSPWRFLASVWSVRCIFLFNNPLLLSALEIHRKIVCSAEDIDRRTFYTVKWLQKIMIVHKANTKMQKEKQNKVQIMIVDMGLSNWADYLLACICYYRFLRKKIQTMAPIFPFRQSSSNCIHHPCDDSCNLSDLSTRTFMQIDR